MGHSLGASAALAIARCLQKKNITVDLLVTIDNRPGRTYGRRQMSQIPDNVKVNYNFFERRDLLLSGIRENTRGPVEKAKETVDKSNIFNVEIYGLPCPAPHLAIDNYTRPLVKILIEKAFRGSLSEVKIKDGSRYKALNQGPPNDENAPIDLVQLCMSLGKSKQFCTVHFPAVL